MESLQKKKKICPQKRIGKYKLRMSENIKRNATQKTKKTMLKKDVKRKENEC